MYVGMSI
jgi:hypothetical protein